MPMESLSDGGVILPLATPEITNRTESQYNKIFSLGHNTLSNKQILDVGSGFSDFTDKVNAKYGKTGTRCRSVDPAYAILAALGENISFETFNEKVRENNRKSQGRYTSFGAYDYRDEKKPNDLEGSHEAITTRLQEMRVYREKAAKALRDTNSPIGDKIKTLDGLPQIAASGLNLPFGDESMDLVLSSNFLLYPLRLTDNEGNIALQESLRVLKKGGELRIFPALGFYTSTYLFHDEENAPILVNTENREFLPDGTSKFYPDYRTFYTLLELEKQDIHSYFVHTQGAHILILMKGSEIPHAFDGEVTVQKLNFLETDPNSIYIKYENIKL